MKKLKTIFALLLVLCVLLGLACACTPQENKQEQQPKTAILKIEGDGVLEARELNAQQIKEAAKDGLYQGDYVMVDINKQRSTVSVEGVNLWYLLSEVVGLKETAKSVSIVANDGFQATYPIDQVVRQDYMDEQNPDAVYPMILSWNYNVQSGESFTFMVGQDKGGEANKEDWILDVAKIVVK